MGYTTKDELLLTVRTVMCAGDKPFQGEDDLRIRSMIIVELRSLFPSSSSSLSDAITEASASTIPYQRLPP